jgi:hypothetical protein
MMAAATRAHALDSAAWMFAPVSWLCRREPCVVARQRGGKVLHRHGRLDLGDVVDGVGGEQLVAAVAQHARRLCKCKQGWCTRA